MMSNIPTMSMTALLSFLLAAMLLATASSAVSSGENVGIVYRVIGVRQGDVLNIRKEPFGGDVERTPIVGSIPFNGRGVLGTTLAVRQAGSEWREIVYRGHRGWVNSRFLTPTGEWPDLTKVDFNCIGTEPFWSLRIRGKTAYYKVNESEYGPLSIVSRKPGVNYSQVLLVTLQTKERPTVVSIRSLAKQSCTDGMSEYEYGYHAFLEDISDFPNGILDGCCMLNYE